MQYNPPGMKSSTFESFSFQTVKRARVSANRFARRILPSSLAKERYHEEREFEEELFNPQVESEAAVERLAAVNYGTWWHNTMEKLGWGKERDRWTDHRRKPDKVATERTARR